MKYITIEMGRFIDDFFDGNKTKCARALSISLTSIWRLTNKTNNPGVKITTSIIKYCEENQIDYRQYLKI